MRRIAYSLKLNDRWRMWYLPHYLGSLSSMLENSGLSSIRKWVLISLWAAMRYLFESKIAKLALMVTCIPWLGKHSFTQRWLDCTIEFMCQELFLAMFSLPGWSDSNLNFCLNVTQIWCFLGCVDAKNPIVSKQIWVTFIRGSGSEMYLIYSHATRIRMIRIHVAFCL